MSNLDILALTASNELEKFNRQHDENNENEPQVKQKKVFNFVSETVINNRLAKKLEAENEKSKGTKISFILNSCPAKALS